MAKITAPISMFAFLMTLSFSSVSKADVVYTYDALGRVASANYGGGVIVHYAYDENGNRLTQVIKATSSTSTWDAFNWGSGTW
jgi:YD repeat-containing protein